MMQLQSQGGSAIVDQCAGVMQILPSLAQVIGFVGWQKLVKVFFCF